MFVGFAARVGVRRWGPALVGVGGGPDLPHDRRTPFGHVRGPLKNVPAVEAPREEALGEAVTTLQTGDSMIDREKVLAVLHKRFPAASSDQLAAAANAIVGLDDEWEDVTSREPELGYHHSMQCSEICYLAEQVQMGAQFRIFKKRFESV